MTIAHDFHYYKPADIYEALELLAKHEKACVLAGGTDLINWLREGSIFPDALIDIKGIAGLNAIELKNDALYIGALTTFSDLIDSKLIAKHFPMFQEMAAHVASMGVRNRATMVGNICSAVPSCDAGPVLLVYDAQVSVRGRDGSKEIPIQQWFSGPKKTVLQYGEIVTGLVIPVPAKNNAGCYVKLGRYNGEDLAQASVAIFSDYQQTRIAFGAVAPTPKRALEIEKIFVDKKISDALIKNAIALVEKEISPITDIRSTKEYRMHMIKIMLERGLKAVSDRLIGVGPEYGEALI